MLNNDNGFDINKEEAVRYYKINSNEGDAQTLHKIIIMYYLFQEQEFLGISFLRFLSSRCLMQIVKSLLKNLQKSSKFYFKNIEKILRDTSLNKTFQFKGKQSTIHFLHQAKLSHSSVLKLMREPHFSMNWTIGQIFN